MARVNIQDKENVGETGNRQQQIWAEDVNTIRNSINAIYDGAQQGFFIYKNGSEFIQASVQETSTSIIFTKAITAPGLGSGVDLSNIAEGSFLIKQNGVIAQASARELPDLIDFTKSIRTLAQSVDLGNNIQVSDLGLNIGITNLITDQEFLALGYEVSRTTGSLDVLKFQYGPALDITFNASTADPRTTTTQAPTIQFPYPFVRDGRGLTYTFSGNSQGQDVLLSMYVGTDTSGHAIVSRENIGPINGQTTITALQLIQFSTVIANYWLVLEREDGGALTIAGDTIDINPQNLTQTTTGPNTITLNPGGQSVGTPNNVWVPFLRAVGQDSTRIKMLEAGDGAEIVSAINTELGNTDWQTPGSGGGEPNVQSDWTETDTNSDAFILNKPTIPTSRTDEDIRDVVGATLVAGSNVTISVDDANDTITISATGTGGGGTPTPVSTDLRYGLSSESDAALVVFSSLTDEGNPTDPITISTGVTTAGQYFHIYSSNTHNITRITDTVLQQDVYVDGGTSNIFTKVSDVRTEGSVTYDSYTIGPLNAGIDEDYVISFS